MTELYQYLAAFFAGAFLSNAVPHFVHGVSGNKFPTPFSRPRGVGLSGSTTNMLWALFNIIIGYLTYSVAGLNSDNKSFLAAFFAGIAFAGIGLSFRFKKKHKEN